MSTLQEYITRISTKLGILVRQHKQLTQVHEQVKAQLHAKEEENKEMQQRIVLLEQQVGILKSAAGQLSEEEKKNLEKKLQQYIREIDRCIALLSE